MVNETFESRQIQALASTSSISEIECLRLGDRGEWQQFMRAPQLEKLIISDDIGKLSGVCMMEELPFFETVKIFSCTHVEVSSSVSIVMQVQNLPAFKKITSLELKPAPAKHFWLQVPHEFLVRIKNLSV